MRKYITLALLGLLTFAAFGCNQPDADDKDRAQQDQMLKQAQEQTGLPAIVNFREKKLLKAIYEMRDQANLQTWTYIVAEQTGKLVFLGRSIGFGIPAATEYTNPMKAEYQGLALPQADPNGLFSPASAEGTWVMMVNPKGDVVPVYIEPRVIVSPFKLE